MTKLSFNFHHSVVTRLILFISNIHIRGMTMKNLTTELHEAADKIMLLLQRKLEVELRQRQKVTSDQKKAVQMNKSAIYFDDFCIDKFWEKSKIIEEILIDNLSESGLAKYDSLHKKEKHQIHVLLANNIFNIIQIDTQNLSQLQLSFTCKIVTVCRLDYGDEYYTAHAGFHFNKAVLANKLEPAFVEVKQQLLQYHHLKKQNIIMELEKYISDCYVALDNHKFSNENERVYATIKSSIFGKVGCKIDKKSELEAATGLLTVLTNDGIFDIEIYKQHKDAYKWSSGLSKLYQECLKHHLISIDSKSKFSEDNTPKYEN